MKLDRRAFLLSLSACSVGAVAGTLGGCEKAVTREDALASLVVDLAVADAESLRLECERLHSEIVRLTKAPALEQLKRSQDQWRQAALCFRRVHVLRTEPVVRSNLLLRAAFWPVRSSVIESLLQDTRAIDRSRIEELGVDVKGMFALEHLLFSRLPAELVRELSLPEGERKRALLKAMSNDILVYATAARHSLADGRAYASSFVKVSEQSMNEVVNTLVSALENVALRLQLVADRHALGTLKVADIEGGLSSSSRDLALASLTASKRVYVGAAERGVSRLVQELSPSIDGNIQSLLEQAIGAVRSLPPALDQAAKATPAALKRAVGLVREVEIAFKTELAGVLGITLSLVSGDGD